MAHLNALELQSLLDGSANDNVKHHLHHCVDCQLALADETAAELTLRLMGKRFATARAKLAPEWDEVSEVKRRPQTAPLALLQAKHELPLPDESPQRAVSSPSVVPAQAVHSRTAPVRTAPVRTAPVRTAPVQTARLSVLWFHLTFAAAAGFLPWLTFASNPVSQQSSAQHELQEARCIRTQPWCR